MAPALLCEVLYMYMYMYVAHSIQNVHLYMYIWCRNPQTKDNTFIGIIYVQM